MRRTTRSLLGSAFVVACLTVPGVAQQVLDQSTAKRQLFGTRNSDLTVVPQPSLSELDEATLKEMPRLASLQYYGALAIDPSVGLQNEASTGAFNYHSLEAARGAAVDGCSAKRSGTDACVIVAEVTPRRYQAGRTFTLSQDASRAVNGRDFGRAGRDAALAISSGTGSWGLGDGEEAAVAACAVSGASDCTIVVAK